MKFVSTGDTAIRVSFEHTLHHPIPAPDHLWVPETIPSITFPQKGAPLSDHIDAVMSAFLPEIWERSMLDEFQDPTSLIPLEFRGRKMHELQLYHGPTESFKDVGCFVAAQIYNKLFDRTKYRVVVATSGDTGGAVAHAFSQINGLPVTILYPRSKISPYQEKQINHAHDPYHRIMPLALSGDFDACQKLAKQLLMVHPTILSSNSISLARLLPQIGYHSWCAAQLEKPCTLVIPSGNMGNACSAFLAKYMGASIQSIHIACNQNDIVARSILRQDECYKPTVQTPASAMDVSKPSNWIRLKHFGVDADNPHVSASSTSSSTINIIQNEIGVCPHTAVGYDATAYIPYTNDYIVVVATASPKKFILNVSPRSPIDRCRYTRPHKLHYVSYQTIFLIGPPCSGKESVAKRLNGSIWKTLRIDTIWSHIQNRTIPTGVVALPPFIVEQYLLMQKLRAYPCSAIVFLDTNALVMEQRLNDHDRWNDFNLKDKMSIDEMLQYFFRKWVSFSDYKIITNHNAISQCVRTIQTLLG